MEHHGTPRSSPYYGWPENPHKNSQQVSQCLSGHFLAELRVEAYVVGCHMGQWFKGPNATQTLPKRYPNATQWVIVIAGFSGWSFQWIGLRENFQESPMFIHISWGNPWFPAIFPLNQSIDHSPKYGNFIGFKTHPLVLPSWTSQMNSHHKACAGADPGLQNMLKKKRSACQPRIKGGVKSY